MPSKLNATVPADSSRGEIRTNELTQRLLEAAAQLFMEKGYDATSMGEISARAHASKETFYRHFPTKEDLFRAVVVQRAERLAQDLGTILVDTQPPGKALKAFGERTLTRLMTEDSIAFHRVLATARERFPDLLELYRTTGGYRVRDTVTRYLKAQIAQGNLRKMDPEVAARQFFDLVAAEMIISANMTGKSNPPRAAIKQRVKEALDCFLHGYAV